MKMAGGGDADVRAGLFSDESRAAAARPHETMKMAWCGGERAGESYFRVSHRAIPACFAGRTGAPPGGGAVADT